MTQRGNRRETIFFGDADYRFYLALLGESAAKAGAEVWAYCLMPNHVHVFFRAGNTPMSKVVNGWKGYTAKQINRRLGRKGRFWQDSYWETYMRDMGHEQRARRYIESNPVKARLLAVASNWLRSSARHRDRYGALKIPATLPEPGHGVLK